MQVVVNRSSKCNFCKKGPVVSIKYREKDGNRTYKLAFHFCKNCQEFFDFIDWKTYNSMPYYNDISNLKVMSVIEPEDQFRVRSIKRDTTLGCVKCKKTAYSRLYLEYERNLYDYVGYVCKKCESAFFVNTLHFRLKKRKEFGFVDEYVGSYVTRSGIPDDDKIVEVFYRLNKKDALKLKKLMMKYNIKKI